MTTHFLEWHYLIIKNNFKYTPQTPRAGPFFAVPAPHWVHTRQAVFNLTEFIADIFCCLLSLFLSARLSRCTDLMALCFCGGIGSIHLLFYVPIFFRIVSGILFQDFLLHSGICFPDVHFHSSIVLFCCLCV